MQEILSEPTQVGITSVINSSVFTALTYPIGRASGDSKAEVAWKYYPTQVCVKFGVHLVGYPQEDICDPSNLMVNELYALHESLQKGACVFKPLSDAERDALRAVANKQERDGKNPYGKRKRRSDAGKLKKKRKTSTSEVHCTTDAHPPSCASSDDSDNDDLSDGGISHETGLHRRMIRPLKAARPTVRRANLSASSRSLASTEVASSASTSAHASSTRPAHASSTCPAPITPSVGRRATPTTGPATLPACGSADSYESESGEDELDWARHSNDPIAHLDRCIESLEDSLEEWESTDG